MSFGETLTEYMERLDCNISDICNKSGLSYSLVNRYVNDIRKPKYNSKYFEKIVEGIYEIALEKNVKLTKASISDELQKSLASGNFDIDYNLFVENFNALQEALNVSTAQISRAIGYDTSFISRLKNKERKPADFENFISKLRDFTISKCQNEQTKLNISKLLECNKNDIKNSEKFNEIFSKWLCFKRNNKGQDAIMSFLTKLDNFNLNDYINTDFSKVKLLTMPIIFKNSKTFFGIQGRKEAEGEFLKTTLLSKSDEPIFFYSDLPISNAGNDEDFKKKWVFAMTALLKRGLHLNMIHNLDRPMEEMLLGLENWIPIYMTGSISPYYFKTPPSNFFLSSHCTSGVIAMSGRCMRNNEKQSKFYLTTKKEEFEFEKEISKYMLSKATPLMKIYKETDKKDFEKFIKAPENKNFQKLKKDTFKNIDFYINEDKWIIINKKTAPEIHFVIYHERLINAIKNFLLS